jgi:hypothetical protein
MREGTSLRFLFALNVHGPWQESHGLVPTRAICGVSTAEDGSLSRSEETVPAAGSGDGY